ncbi:hypothetical protein FHL15_003854 [Xylaria flabelliformis]|uniref:Uncharacterized protein n=1 Tax=Xylaria flabelliformis TaxID=2512241 RepID=A0A553I4N3_9PEZI|nr:hypothetical protein FHL15_003854 [Xylaria flabelliformis]
MNWTEGSLARHSRGRQRNALLARQKQHFAKARNNLLNERAKQRPIKISFLASESSTESPSRVPVSRRPLDEPSSPLTLTKRESRQEFPTCLRDGNHEVLPTNLDRRKRLLEKSDWAGLGLQKPLDISFPGQVYATKRWTRVARAPERALNGTTKHAAAHGDERHERLKRSSIRIQIGSQEVRPSIAASSQSSIERRTLEPKQQSSMSPRDRMSETVRYVDSPGRQRHGYTNISSDCTSRASLALLGGPETPVNVIYSSSVIYEPAPRRHSDFQVLQWSPSGSEDRGSMQVEIGRRVRPVSHSQESEQQRWKDWILAGDNSNHPSDSPLTIMDAVETYTEGSGSSSLTLPSHLQPRLPSLHLSSEADPKPEHGPSGHEDTGVIIGSHGNPQDSRCLREKHSLLSSNRQCTPLKKRDDTDDLNNIWMKFAFGDDDDSEELVMGAFKEAAHQAAAELRPSDTSGSTEEYTESTAMCRGEVSSLGRESECDTIFNESSSDSNMATKGTTGSETALSNMATIGSKDEPPRNSTRFTVPKAFIGKYAKADTTSVVQPSVAGMPRSGKKGKGKRRKMAADGRPEIRNLPNFYGDPIEDIEDD